MTEELTRRTVLRIGGMVVGGFGTTGCLRALGGDTTTKPPRTTRPVETTTRIESTTPPQTPTDTPTRTSTARPVPALDPGPYRAPGNREFPMATDAFLRLLTPGSAVAAGDVAVVGFDVSGADNPSRLPGILPEAPGQTLELVQTNPGVNRDPVELDLLSSPPGTTLFVDPEAGVLFAAIDTARFDDMFPDWGYGDGAGVVFRCRIALNQSAEVSLSGASLTGSWEVEIVSPSASLEVPAGAQTLRLPNSVDASVAARTTLAPGNEVSFRLEFDGSSDTLENTATVRPVDGEDVGRAETGIDLSGVAAESPFTIAVSGPRDTLLWSGSGTVVEPARGSLTFQDQRATEDGTLVRIASVSSTKGGFVAIHRETAAGDIVGASRRLEAGDHQDVAIRLESPGIDSETTLVAVLHQDTNDNNVFDYNVDPSLDTPYTGAADGPVADTATVSP